MIYTSNKMKRIILGLALAAVVTARPEQYREKEDFQYSRTSSDEGTKSGFYDAQRGNMGGNYERAHNMDNLAQNQMGGLITQVEGELGDGTRTRTGNVYSAANSRGIYGSGHYDLSKLGGRNFQESSAFDNSQSSQSSLHSAFDANSQRSSHRNALYTFGGHNANSDYSKYQSSNSRGAENLYDADQYNQEAQSSHDSRHYLQSGSQGRHIYQKANTDYAAGQNLDTNTHNRLITTVPVKIVVRPGQRIAIPIATQNYGGSHVASYYDQIAANSEAEILSSNGLQENIQPHNTDKNYESSYSYHKQWEKHDTQPAIIPTDKPIPKNSELYDDSVLQQSFQLNRNEQNHDLRTLGQSRQQADFQTRHQSSSLSNSRSNAYNQIESNSELNSQSSSLSNSRSNAYNPIGSNSELNSQSSSLSNSRSNAYNQIGSNSKLNSNLANLVGTLSASPKNYQSSYSYHKSWERQGDPYIIKPVSNGMYEGQSSAGLTDASYYGSQNTKSQRLTYNTNCMVECEPTKSRVVRSYSDHDHNSQQIQDIGQEAQNQWYKQQYLGQQAENQWNNLEELGQHTQNENIDELGQQTQNQFDNLKDLGQQTQNTFDNLEDLSQQSQSKFDTIEDLGQQTQNINSNLETLGQQTQNNFDDFKNIGQDTQDRYDSYRHFGQETENKVNFDNLGQQTENKFNNFEDLGQHTQTKWNTDLKEQSSQGLENLNKRPQKKLRPHSQHNWEVAESINTNENINQQTQDNWEQTEGQTVNKKYDIHTPEIIPNSELSNQNLRNKIFGKLNESGHYQSNTNHYYLAHHHNHVQTFEQKTLTEEKKDSIQSEKETYFNNINNKDLNHNTFIDMPEHTTLNSNSLGDLWNKLNILDEDYPTQYNTNNFNIENGYFNSNYNLQQNKSYHSSSNTSHGQNITNESFDSVFSFVESEKSTEKPIISQFNKKLAENTATVLPVNEAVNSSSISYEAAHTEKVRFQDRDTGRGDIGSDYDMLELLDDQHDTVQNGISIKNENTKPDEIEDLSVIRGNNFPNLYNKANPYLIQIDKSKSDSVNTAVNLLEKNNNSYEHIQDSLSGVDQQIDSNNNFDQQITTPLRKSFRNYFQKNDKTQLNNINIENYKSEKHNNDQLVDFSGDQFLEKTNLSSVQENKAQTIQDFSQQNEESTFVGQESQSLIPNDFQPQSVDFKQERQPLEHMESSMNTFLGQESQSLIPNDFQQQSVDFEQERQPLEHMESSMNTFLGQESQSLIPNDFQQQSVDFEQERQPLEHMESSMNTFPGQESQSLFPNDFQQQSVDFEQERQPLEHMESSMNTFLGQESQSLIPNDFQQQSVDFEQERQPLEHMESSMNTFLGQESQSLIPNDFQQHTVDLERERQPLERMKSSSNTFEGQESQSLIPNDFQLQSVDFKQERQPLEHMESSMNTFVAQDSQRLVPNDFQQKSVNREREHQLLEHMESSMNTFVDQESQSLLHNDFQQQSVDVKPEHKSLKQMESSIKSDIGDLEPEPVEDQNTDLSHKNIKVQAKKSNYDEDSISAITTEVSTTEKPGFWKSVSNKFSSAKNKVSSWFGS